MTDSITISIDGVEIPAETHHTILEAADKAGIYIPRLCAYPGLKPNGSCRVCTVLVNGRPQTACTTPVMKGMVIQNETPELKRLRSNLIEMLFVEGNHYCMFCEKSGNCELQGMAYRLGIKTPHFPYLEPKREIDATHPDVLIDHNRCIFCGRCIQASKTFDGKNVFQYIGRTRNKKVGVNADDGLGETDFAATDRAAQVCPVGAILKKRVGFKIPIGKRIYDRSPIGSEIEVQPKDAGSAQ
ncbi:MAG TPA: NADP oxidoreductase [Verrucomicrobia bacterium]|nr:MAG: NADP oxidoreductase [Lentisphaerae bacterium GWF2_57_35]HBA85980.1 NADP oxidoreductase [Verrucomicrobiota bacterium]